MIGDVGDVDPLDVSGGDKYSRKVAVGRTLEGIAIRVSDQEGCCEDDVTVCAFLRICVEPGKIARDVATVV